ncbi:BMP family ABC transporter substrate-binding protein [Phototrophicus methaneseepsis]|uniref:BMP family ABC transporter substrate-binding protein n=1 Tax=Phototrophicus methaneseepsis TaxID=2710758 RepID=A0A7S8EBM1_9CHLR|nr:BMP family ABC transporter substrate-binding protein [Phototrophicus methaneseepsis]QPC83961.1 BMP family ABC transporter substrate-binding protein [Phototrophicus methaneseepsis]
MYAARKWFLGVIVLLVGVLVIAPAAAQDDEFVFGMILVGPSSDQGWSQAHYEAGEYVIEKLAEEGITARQIVFENLNPAVNPQTTLMDVVESMVDEGAQLIFTTSDEFEPDTLEAAAEYPEVAFVHATGSAALGQSPADIFPDLYEAVEAEAAPENFANIMGEMEYGKMIAGCAAALTTETGKISYLGPLTNAETRRLVASAYLGAKYCYENYAGGDPAALGFEVIWIGYWIPTPDTLDPAQVTNTFFDTGSDVVISGIDPQDALIVAGQRREQGDNVYAIPYDYVGACETAPDACLGIPYFNWGPSYLEFVQEVMAGEFEPTWEWLGPDWADINAADTSAVGWENGPALSEEAAASLESFIAEIAAFEAEDNEAFFLWEGPLNYQDGTVLAEEGEFVDPLAIWYLPQLLEGITGDSTLSE